MLLVDLNIQVYGSSRNVVTVTKQSLGAGAKLVVSGLLCRWKMDAIRVVENIKTRLVAQGCTQKLELDYEGTFSLVVWCKAIMFLPTVGLNASYSFIKCISVSTALLHGMPVTVSSNASMCLLHSYMENWMKKYTLSILKESLSEGKSISFVIKSMVYIH